MPRKQSTMKQASFKVNGATVLATKRHRGVSRRVSVTIPEHELNGDYLAELYARNAVRNELNALGYSGPYTELKWRFG
ncbi:hypothetical protein KW429_11830 [Vibrio fluvialis]|nr:hypothetical protein [Vibrio fluvialis]MBY7902361.1 hypothetical protein [Vibrio fluvialis]